jgi:hypothetical protein
MVIMDDSYSILGEVNYTDTGGKIPCFYAYDNTKDYMPLQRRKVKIRNARKLLSPALLDKDGFQLAFCPTAINDFWNLQETNDVYIGELEKLICSLTGASCVVVTSIGLPRTSKKKNNDDVSSVDKALHFIHSDFSDDSAWWWVEQIIDKDSFEILKNKRLAIYGTWRSISSPPQAVPFALCKANSIKSTDIVSANAFADYPGEKEIQWEALMFKYNPAHEWYYYPDLTREELILFKHFDSDKTKAVRCPHTAFVDDSYSPMMPPRISLDTRIIAFFD